ncbi:N-acetylmannosaminyltransferase [Geosporobacter ferrireducens]|uniref:N-acetylglucosaminyldiphosphoundecaprenol N-acetyl-beta-D-mannosaminyltransferase n=1 Tax=Geosporobacter ferrireducens TaxID=1424294 RepID=A0A1D8GQL6_9FIRM|nr:N-acetylmannosaminyltransferase [Geosporobacter ferrireducens]MTI55488.1 WecB/TagA/CpsF family glycosyltransferase [Geosporobacter ferrireducens]
MNRVEIMGVPIDAVDMPKAVDQAVAFFQQENLQVIYTPNTEIVMAAQQDPILLDAIKAANLVIPDGIGLIYASKILNKGLKERVTGVDLMGEVLSYCNQHGKSIYILGGKPGIAEVACKNIQIKFPEICISGFNDGYFQENETAAVIEKINQSNVDILFVGLGAPKQEKWIFQYRDKLKAKIAMGVGGGVDIWAGTVKRAPEVYQKLGLEWFYRLLKEPWRYKRMMSLPKFMIKVLFSKK